MLRPHPGLRAAPGRPAGTGRRRRAGGRGAVRARRRSRSVTTGVARAEIGGPVAGPPGR